MNGKTCFRSFLFLVVGIAGASSVYGQGFIARKKVAVGGPASIDWRIAVTGRSNPEIEENAGYKSTAQRYDYYGPSQAVRPMPMVLFVSYRSTPMGHDYLGRYCQQNGIILVEPWKVGNSVQASERIRIAIDCLDDVRKRFPIDPDRTYLAGYSGGASVAQIIARNLPEYFGGVLTANTSYGPPQSAWTLDRCRNRLSFAMIVGENEAAGFEMSQVQRPIFDYLGIRSRCHVIPRAGHAAPPPASFAAALAWLEAGTADRKRRANERPALRISGNQTRLQWAESALHDARTILQDETQIDLALGLLEDVIDRWPELETAEQAQDLLDDYETREEKPWLETAKRQRLDRTRMFAKTYDQAAFSKGSLAKMPRAVYAQAAIKNYSILAAEETAPSVVSEAQERIKELQVMADKAPAKYSAVAVGVDKPERIASDVPDMVRMRFSFDGPFILRDLLNYLQEELEHSELQLRIDAAAISKAGRTLDVRIPLAFENESLRAILDSSLRPARLVYKIEKGGIAIIPIQRHVTADK